MNFILERGSRKRVHRFHSGAKAFSLVEVVLAIGVFSVAMVANMAVIGVIFNGVRSVSDRDMAVGLTSTLEDTLQSTTLSSVYGWVTGGNTVPLYAYNYRGQITATSGSDPIPVTDSSTISYTLVPALRTYTDTRLATELAVREGPLYRVILNVSNANPVSGANLPSDSSSYTETVLAVNAAFYAVANTTMTVKTNLPPTHSITLIYRR